jgi:hypothetical protein
MQLTVSPEKDDAGLVGMLRGHWTTLASKYDARAPLTFSNVLFAYSAECFPATACACLPGHGDTKEWRIEVNTAWFSTLSAERQELTLLHEWIHLRFMSGDLRDQYLQAWGQSSYGPDAMLLWNFVHEVAAEYYLVREFPELRQERGSYLVDMAVQADSNGPQGNHEWWAFYQLLRFDLASEVKGEPLEAGALDAYRLTETLLAKERVPTEARILRRRMLALKLDPFQYDAEAFNFVRDRIQALHLGL